MRPALRVREYVEQLEKVLTDDNAESQEHFREAWKHLQGIESGSEDKKGSEPFLDK